MVQCSEGNLKAIRLRILVNGFHKGRIGQVREFPVGEDVLPDF